MHHQGENTAMFALVVIVVVAFVWFVGKVIGAIFSVFSGANPAPEMPTDIVRDALAVVSTPMPLPGGRWGFYETKLVECPAPMAPNNLEVHDVSAPGHDAKTCRHCQPLKGYSGVSFRPG